MNTKSYIAGAIGIAVTILGVSYFGKPIVNVSVPPSNPTPVQVNVPEQGAPTVNVAPAQVSVNVPPQAQAPAPANPILGSVTGPDSFFPYYSENNLKRYGLGTKMIAATTTPCKYTTPADATTTLFYASADIYTGTTTAAGTFTLSTTTSRPILK